MDAKPHRIRVKGDENASVRLVPNKTIHQRNKSSPALTTMLQNGGLKNAAKRTAFGDLSNVSHPVRSIRDDSSLPGQNLPNPNRAGKVALVAQEKKPVAFVQPAQRPVSVSNLKGLLAAVTNTKATDSSARQGPTDNAPQHVANSRKALTKRNTTIFKDPVPSGLGINPTASKHDLPRSSDVVREEPEKRPSASHFQPQADDAKRDESARCSLNTSSDPEMPKGRSSDGVCIHHGHKVDACEIHNSGAGWKEDQIPVTNNTTSGLREMKLPESKTHLEPESRIPHDSIDLAHARYGRGQGLSEPEEYWDDEEEDNEEDDGYVTARSYRSRGDNTTGGATTILFPKYNQKVKQELAFAKQLVEATRSVQDVEDEYWDTSMVAEYGDEIFEYMRQQEIKMLPNAHYMDNQVDIQWSMRSVLMDWLVQVHHRFSLLPETLFLCVNYIDRFLSCKIVSLGKLQLVGATAILIAAKYEEINCPSVGEIVYMVDGGYTPEEILKAERFMLSMLQFELGWPGPMSFLRRISKADEYDLETRTLAKYFLEVTIMDERFVGSPPSFAAAAAHCLARIMLKKGHWSQAHIYYSNYTYWQLYPIVSLILECCENPQKHHAAIFEKYTDRRFKRASRFVEAELRRGFGIRDLLKESPQVNDAFEYSYVKRK